MEFKKKILPKVVEQNWQRIVKEIYETELPIVKHRLLDKEEGPGWSELQYKKAVDLYKKFIMLCCKYPEESIVPTKEIDAVWHQHILDTKAYTEFCKKYFGTYLHHDPSVGIGSEESKKELQELFERTDLLWQSEFGFSLKPSQKTFDCSATCAGRCKY